MNREHKTILSKSVWEKSNKKHGNAVMPGLAANSAALEVDRERREKEKMNAGVSSDTANRQQVASQISELVKDGMTVEKAVEIVANNPENREKFDYLIKAGIDLNNIFKNLYQGSLKNKSRGHGLSR